jgi:hypothetical protein
MYTPRSGMRSVLRYVMDECPKQLIGETRRPVPVKPGQAAWYDRE